MRGCHARTSSSPRSRGGGLRGWGSGSGTLPLSALSGLALTTQRIDLVGGDMDSRRRFRIKDSDISCRHRISTFMWENLDAVVAGCKAGVKPILPTVAISRVGCGAQAPFPTRLVDLAPFNVRHAEGGVCDEMRIG